MTTTEPTTTWCTPPMGIANETACLLAPMHAGLCEPPVPTHPNAEGADVICADPDCGSANCTGEHGPIRCTKTGELNTMIATRAGRWTCCGGLYPDHELTTA